METNETTDDLSTVTIALPAAEVIARVVNDSDSQISPFLNPNVAEAFSGILGNTQMNCSPRMVAAVFVQAWIDAGPKYGMTASFHPRGYEIFNSAYLGHLRYVVHALGLGEIVEREVASLIMERSFK